MGDCFRPWSSLAEVIRDGSPVADGFDQIARGGDYTRNIILDALGPGREIVDALDLAGRRRMLDVGGGPGTYSILLAERYPELTAEVFDLPPVLEIARELIEQFGASDRVRTREGNYLTDDWGSGHDVILMSNILHQESPESCTALLRKAHAALADAGCSSSSSRFSMREDGAGVGRAAVAPTGRAVRARALVFVPRVAGNAPRGGVPRRPDEEYVAVTVGIAGPRHEGAELGKRGAGVTE